METLVDLFEHVLRSNPPERELLRIRAGRDWRTYTVRGFEEAVRAYAGRLAHAGVVAADRVALYCETRPEWHIVDLACQLSGAILVPLYPTLPASVVAHIVADAGAKLLVVSGKERAQLALQATADLPGVRVVGLDHTLGLEPFADLAVAPALAARRPDPNDLASLIYTSGTTGEPKGVMLTHRNFMSQVTTILPLYPITNKDYVMSFLPLSHVFQRILDYIFLYAGCHITYVEAVEKAGPMLTIVRPTIMASVPRVYERAYVQIMSRVLKEPRLARLFEWAMAVGRRVKEAEWAVRRAPAVHHLGRRAARPEDRRVLRHRRPAAAQRVRAHGERSRDRRQPAGIEPARIGRAGSARRGDPHRPRRRQERRPPAHRVAAGDEPVHRPGRCDRRQLPVHHRAHHTQHREPPRLLRGAQGRRRRRGWDRRAPHDRGPHRPGRQGPEHATAELRAHPAVHRAAERGHHRGRRDHVSCHARRG